MIIVQYIEFVLLVNNKKRFQNYISYIEVFSYYLFNNDLIIMLK